MVPYKLIQHLVRSWWAPCNNTSLSLDPMFALLWTVYLSSYAFTQWTSLDSSQTYSSPSQGHHSSWPLLTSGYPSLFKHLVTLIGVVIAKMAIWPLVTLFILVRMLSPRNQLAKNQYLERHLKSNIKQSQTPLLRFSGLKIFFMNLVFIYWAIRPQPRFAIIPVLFISVPIQFHSRMKHIALEYHFLRECINNDSLHLHYQHQISNSRHSHKIPWTNCLMLYSWPLSFGFR